MYTEAEDYWYWHGYDPTGLRVDDWDYPDYYENEEYSYLDEDFEDANREED